MYFLTSFLYVSNSDLFREFEVHIFIEFSNSDCHFGFTYDKLIC